MIINHNLAAMNTYNKLTANNAATSKSLEKLSSGLRINRAGDDAAGLAISEKMRGQIRGLDQASSNAQDGISMLQTAEGNLNETHSILQRMKELATQAANDTNVGVDRGEIQKEINQLTSEINRIGNTTEFNTQKLLNGGGDVKEIDPTTLKAGGKNGAIAAFAQVTGSVAEKKGSFKLAVTAGTYSAGNTFSIGGQTFTVVTGSADASRGEVAAGTANGVAASLGAAINANATLHARFANVTVATNNITLTENAGAAAGGTATDLTLSANLTPTTSASSVKEVVGKYTYNLDQAFEVANATLTIGGQALLAVSSNAGAGQFNISSDKTKQAQDIAAAINSNTTLSAHYQATANGTTLTLTEKATKATGLNMQAGSASVSPTSAVSGKYDIGFSSLVSGGGRITVDGQDIAVVTDSTDSRLASGQAMLAATNLHDQAANLVSAINKNSALNQKYTASMNGDKAELLQKTGKETLTAPVVTTNTSQKDTFEATLQIGANTAQSMTITIGDMRSKAIGLTSNDANTTSITTKNGTVASFVATANVTNGTTNDNVEFSLDVSTHEKATAAISAISDAIEKVSAQRSQLGAFQNRLEHTVTNLTTSSENMSAAESRIRDVNMAKEMMNFQKNNILSQAAQAMLAQANQQPQNVLQLLR